MVLTCKQCDLQLDVTNQQSNCADQSPQLCEQCIIRNDLQSPNSKDEFENEREIGIKCYGDPMGHISVVFCRECEYYLCKKCALTSHFSHKMVRVSDTPGNVNNKLLPPAAEISNTVESINRAHSTESNENHDTIIENLKAKSLEIDRIVRKLSLHIVKLEVCSSTYNHKDATMFTEMRQKLYEHFKDFPNEVKENESKKLETFVDETIHKCKKEKNDYETDINILQGLKEKIKQVIDEPGNNCNNPCKDLAGQLRLIDGKIGSYRTKIFELKVIDDNSTRIDIIEENCDLEIVLGPFFDAYISQETNHKARKYSGQRFKYPNSVKLFQDEESFKLCTERVLPGKDFYEIVENTPLVFTMPNIFRNDEICKVERMTSNNPDIKIRIMAEPNEEINEELKSWLETKRLHCFSII